MKPRILISRSEGSAAELYVAALYGVGCIADSVYAPPPSSEGYGGLLLAGGGDIDPALYGEEIRGSRSVDRARDDAEIMLCDSFAREGKPILGICRGHQLLNVYLGGSLFQHIDRHSDPNGAVLHSVRTEKGSVMRTLFGEYPPVNSFHHQSIRRLGSGLCVTQACEDGTVEAVEHRSLPIIGVQWHPERMCLDQMHGGAVDSLPLFEYFASLLRQKM